MTSWRPVGRWSLVNQSFHRSVNKLLRFKCDKHENAKKSGQKLMKLFRIRSRHLKWSLVGTLFVVALGACSMSPEYSSRPANLNDVRPSNGPVTRVNVNMPVEIERKQLRLRPAANLPKPLLANVVTPERRLQCVPYARDLSNIQIRGNAWTWWDQAEGRYPRSGQPKAGSVLVLKRKENTGSLGHVAYVDEVIHDRMIIVSHANWLNEGRLHNHTPVLDVSPANDWSEVRFWHTPGQHFGGNIYRPYGFILPNQTVASR